MKKRLLLLALLAFVSGSYVYSNNAQKFHDFSKQKPTYLEVIYEFEKTMDQFIPLRNKYNTRKVNNDELSLNYHQNLEYLESLMATCRMLAGDKNQQARCTNLERRLGRTHNIIKKEATAYSKMCQRFLDENQNDIEALRYFIPGLVRHIEECKKSASTGAEQAECNELAKMQVSMNVIPVEAQKEKDSSAE